MGNCQCPDGTTNVRAPANPGFHHAPSAVKTEPPPTELTVAEQFLQPTVNVDECGVATVCADKLAAQLRFLAVLDRELALEDILLEQLPWHSMLRVIWCQLGGAPTWRLDPSSDPSGVALKALELIESRVAAVSSTLMYQNARLEPGTNKPLPLQPEDPPRTMDRAERQVLLRLMQC